MAVHPARCYAHQHGGVEVLTSAVQVYEGRHHHSAQLCRDPKLGVQLPWWLDSGLPDMHWKQQAWNHNDTLPANFDHRLIAGCFFSPPSMQNTSALLCLLSRPGSHALHLPLCLQPLCLQQRMLWVSSTHNLAA